MMHEVPQTGLTLPAVARRGLNEGLGRTARKAMTEVRNPKGSAALRGREIRSEFMRPVA